MKRVRKESVVVESEQWHEVAYDREAGHGFSIGHLPNYHLQVGYYRRPDIDGQQRCGTCGKIMHLHGWIDTLEGGRIVCPGDWIIRGVEGEYYPCKPDIYERTYEPIEEEALV